MFWDTTDLFTDSKKQLKIKAHRRKSNYYETKSQSLQFIYNTINKKITDVQDNYRFSAVLKNGQQADVINFLYWEKENELYASLQLLVADLKDSRDDVKRRLNKVKDLHDTYYQLAIRE